MAVQHWLGVAIVAQLLGAATALASGNSPVAQLDPAFPLVAAVPTNPPLTPAPPAATASVTPLPPAPSPPTVAEPPDAPFPVVTGPPGRPDRVVPDEVATPTLSGLLQLLPEISVSVPPVG